PSFGQSKKKGTTLSAAWYQVIDRNMDATLQIDSMSKLGLGKGIEYRYLLGRDNLGEARFYHVSGHGDEPDLHAFNWQHAGTLPGRIWLSVDAEYVEEQLFFENFGKVADEYNQDKTVTQVWLQRNWQTLNTVLRGRYVRDIENPRANPLQRLPELAVTLAPWRFGESPLYFGFDSSLTRFERDDGVEGDRLFLRPALSAAFRLGNWLDFVPELAFSQRFYDTDLGEDDRFLPELSATLGSRLERVYSWPENAGVRVKHSIEPTVRYLFRPDRDESDLPLFDPNDRRADISRLEYALINRLVLRQENGLGVASYRELLFLRLSQSYDFDGESVDFDRDRQDRLEKEEPFSDLRVELDLRPTPASRLYLDGLVGMYGDSGLSSLRAGASLQVTAGNTASLNYVYRDQDFIGSATEYLGATLETSLLKPVHLRFQERYDLKDHQTLETVVNLEYRSHCWSLFLEIRDRLEDDLIMIGFSLSGLGQIGTGI
ncbi:MAG: LPS assembly protein LptD, partial [Desulfuromonadales bacterium]|nr:LPS assembly protein LptD [Desulfuromonadales bacterium]